MRLRSDEGDWICSRMEGAMMHMNVEIRAKWENEANEGKEYELEDGSGGIYGVWVDREVIQVLCKLFLKLNKQRLGKSRT